MLLELTTISRVCLCVSLCVCAHGCLWVPVYVCTPTCVCGCGCVRLRVSVWGCVCVIHEFVLSAIILVVARAISFQQFCNMNTYSK